MAILSKDEFFKRLNEQLGNDTSDSAISLIEDMTDTYNSLEEQLQGDGTNWEEKYNALDEAWRKKYQSRFFSSGGGRTPIEENIEETIDNTAIKINDLFEEV